MRAEQKTRALRGPCFVGAPASYFCFAAGAVIGSQRWLSATGQKRTIWQIDFDSSRRQVISALASKPIKLRGVVNHDLLKGLGIDPFMRLGNECLKMPKLLMVGARPVTTPKQRAGSHFSEQKRSQTSRVNVSQTISATQLHVDRCNTCTLFQCKQRRVRDTGFQWFGHMVQDKRYVRRYLIKYMWQSALICMNFEVPIQSMDGCPDVVRPRPLWDVMRHAR